MAELPDSSPIKILLVDDDAGVLRALATLFGRDAGFICIPTQDPVEAIGIAEEESPDVVLSDMRMPKMDGLALLLQLKAKCPATEVVLMTGFGTVQSAVAAVKAGAYDFLTKPFEDVSVVELAVRQAAEHKRLRSRNEQLEAALAARDGFEGLVGSSPEMQKVYKLIDTVAHSDATILIEGESGTGKELVARALHFRSARKDQPFLAVNCSALPAGLIESELFGHTRGAFTGAVAAKKGFFEAAHRGTLFLDEVADLPPNAQVQLLRVLQEGEVRRVGATEVVKTDVRVVAATNIDLAKAKAQGRFREDLYYRLNVVPIHLPPLRERPDDILGLAQHFLVKYAQRNHKETPRLSNEALEVMRRYRWPGNVRELENAMERALLLTQEGVVTPDELNPQIAEAHHRLSPEIRTLSHLPYAEAKQSAVHTFERRYLGALMRKSSGNVSEAARAAGMDRSNFRRLLRAHGVDNEGAMQLDDEGDEPPPITSSTPNRN